MSSPLHWVGWFGSVSDILLRQYAENYKQNMFDLLLLRPSHMRILPLKVRNKFPMCC